VEVVVPDNTHLREILVGTVSQCPGVTATATMIKSGDPETARHLVADLTAAAQLYPFITAS
jgi:hypothetical protein